MVIKGDSKITISMMVLFISGLIFMHKYIEAKTSNFMTKDEVLLNDKIITVEMKSLKQHIDMRFDNLEKRIDKK